MYNKFNINKKTLNFVNEIENGLNDDFICIERVYEQNQLKVLNSFINNHVSESHFLESSGYGYNDTGRDVIENVYKDIFNTEDALVRQQFVSGTHVISNVLFALLRPGNTLLSITGKPYDTILKTIGIIESKSSLKEYGINFKSIDLIDNHFDFESIKKEINSSVKVIMIQRSRGYSDKYPISLTDIKNVIEFIKSINNNIIIFVDNCYGEFVDSIEPTDVGADIMCGSLIKNPGGSLAKTGGYIVGKKDLIELCAFRLTAPGIGKEVGISFNQNRRVLQGLYFAPQIVKNALKINRLFAKTLNKLNIKTIPMSDEKLSDIVLAIKFDDKNKLIKFCNVIQSTSPVDAFLKPISENMPGYEDEIIMAAGCFISGSSIELSCDAPIREPYIAFLQGGIDYYQGKLALMKTIDELDLY